MSETGIDRACIDRFTVEFTCNICGLAVHCDRAALGREDASCANCGSSVRVRAMMHLLSRELFGRSLALPEFPVRPDLIGFGLSDWDVYARQLSSKLGYVNTFYHTAPFLDITGVPDELAGIADFVVSTDVFEHVLSPVSRAFRGARRLLRDGGVLIFSVPFHEAHGPTIEHFAEIAEYSVDLDADGVYRLRNKREDGRIEVFENLVFHGGPGETLEMRQFTLEALRSEFAAAGFRSVTLEDEDVVEWGIHWNSACSVPMVARA
jgi:SAM-dependent methyltransferase